MTRKLLFQENDALKYDPTYPGISGWWADKFDRDFSNDYIAAKDTEVDCGDVFTRILTINGETYKVERSFDGYSVYQDVAEEPAPFPDLQDVRIEVRGLHDATVEVNGHPIDNLTNIQFESDVRGIPKLRLTRIAAKGAVLIGKMKVEVDNRCALCHQLVPLPHCPICKNVITSKQGTTAQAGGYLVHNSCLDAPSDLTGY